MFTVFFFVCFVFFSQTGAKFWTRYQILRYPCMTKTGCVIEHLWFFIHIGKCYFCRVKMTEFFPTGWGEMSLHDTYNSYDYSHCKWKNLILPRSLIIGKTRGVKWHRLVKHFLHLWRKICVSFISAQSHASKLMFPLQLYFHHPYSDTYLHWYDPLF